MMNFDEIALVASCTAHGFLFCSLSILEVSISCVLSASNPVLSSFRHGNILTLTLSRPDDQLWFYFKKKLRQLFHRALFRRILEADVLPKR